MTGSDFSMIVIPDTQDVCTSHPDKLNKMTQWIVDYAKELKVKMILHVGDVVNNGELVNEQWLNHKQAFDKIDEAGIPMIIGIGNHDYDNLLNENRDSTAFNHYCGMDRYRGKPWFGGVFEEGKAENLFAKLEIEGRKFLFLSLEFGPRNEVLDWANEILKQHEEYEAIVVTHCYMYGNGERTKPGDDHNPKIYKGLSDTNDGDDIWHKLIKHHSNIVSVYSGHHIPDNVSYRFDTGLHGNLVFQSFQNWQGYGDGGNGRIRVLHYDFQAKRVTLDVFNPDIDDYEKHDGYKMSHPFFTKDVKHHDWLDMKFPRELSD